VDYKEISDSEIEIEGLRIHLDNGDNYIRYRERGDVFYMSKSRGYLDSYRQIASQLFNQSVALNILEMGILQGGSVVFFDKFFEPRKLVCIDIMRDPAPALERYPGSHIRKYYGTSQADAPAVKRIIQSEFREPIDLVIDDASHWYEETRTSFEAVFPYLRPGGIYIIEDWTWAHGSAAQRDDHIWRDKHALTNLILQLVMVAGSDAGVISRMGLLTGLAWIERGTSELSKEHFSLSAWQSPRGRALTLI